MNFFAAPITFQEWTELPSFVATMLVLILTPLAFYIWFRRRAWL